MDDIKELENELTKLENEPEGKQDNSDDKPGENEEDAHDQGDEGEEVDALATALAKENVRPTPEIEITRTGGEPPGSSPDSPEEDWKNGSKKDKGVPSPIIIKTAPIDIGEILLKIGAWICTYILRIPTDPDEKAVHEPQEVLPLEEIETDEEENSEEEEDSQSDNS